MVGVKMNATLAAAQLIVSNISPKKFRMSYDNININLVIGAVTWKL